MALLPPLVVFGMLLGCAEWGLAWGAFLLLLVNIMGINLSGVMVFLIQGIQPRRWWEAERARRATKNAIALWILILLGLIVVILLSEPS